MSRIVRAIEKTTSKVIDNRLANLENKISERYQVLKTKDEIDYDTTLNYNLADTYSKKIIDVSRSYIDTILNYADFARKTTVPINWFLFWYLKRANIYEHNILFEQGVHFFVALQGGGKSTLSYELISRLLAATGKSAYVNAKFEVPKYDPISEKFYLYFKYFKLLDFFDLTSTSDDVRSQIEVTQLKKFNRNFDTIVLDEWLTEMNHRLNRTKDYNNIFMALITMIAHMRHQKIKRIYVLSQIDNTDIQLYSMFKYVHEIEIDLNISYADWVATGMLDKHIKGWTVWTYGMKRNRKTLTTDKVLRKKQYISATADFEYFDTYAMAEKYASLKEDKIKFVKE